MLIAMLTNLSIVPPSGDNAFVKPKKRKRRTADEARTLILDAAERRLSESGPGGIRLQDVADDVGVSHPAILHHFGSREGLVRAVVDRALGGLEADLLASFVSADGKPPDGAAMLDRVSETLADRGHGRLVAWLALSGYADAMNTKSARENWKAIIEGTHALRTSRGLTPTHEDTSFTVILSSLAMLGHAIVGPTVFRLAGMAGDPDVERRFRKWLNALLVAHMER
jgi:AcrR family transcriptional regulator